MLQYLFVFMLKYISSNVRRHYLVTFSDLFSSMSYLTEKVITQKHKHTNARKDSIDWRLRSSETRSLCCAVVCERPEVSTANTDAEPGMADRGEELQRPW